MHPSHQIRLPLMHPTKYNPQRMPPLMHISNTTPPNAPIPSNMLASNAIAPHPPRMQGEECHLSHVHYLSVHVHVYCLPALSTIYIFSVPNPWKYLPVHVHEIYLLALSMKNIARWPLDGATCISSKFGHLMAPLALVPNFATRWRHSHWFRCWPPGWVTCIATLPWAPFWHYQLVLSWYLHQPESHQLSLHKGLRLTQWERLGPIDRTRDTWVR